MLENDITGMGKCWHCGYVDLTSDEDGIFRCGKCGAIPMFFEEDDRGGYTIVHDYPPFKGTELQKEYEDFCKETEAIAIKEAEEEAQRQRSRSRIRR